MRLIVGGQGQGKLAYVLAEGFTTEACSLCGFCEPSTIFEKQIIYNLHEAIRQWMASGIDPLSFILAHVKEEHIIVCNEVGCGIVPADPFERQYRDTVGIVCCALAKRASVVERVCCGIPKKLKG